jgi:hypothetical protein
MSTQRVIGPILALLVLAGVGAAIAISSARKSAQDKLFAATSSIVTIKGMIGSEKESFFSDPRLVAALARNGLRVKVEKVGSREITSRDLNGYDFGFPSGAPGAIALQKKAQARQVYTTFFTPMAVASWKPLIPVLEQERIVRKEGEVYFISDMKRLLSLIDSGARWRELKGNQVYNTGKSILINSTDVRKSNSAAMYLALASYIANGNDVVNDREQADRVLPQMAALFLRQGLQEGSSAGPFEDYVTMGMGKAPLVVIYESQFLEYQARHANRNPDMVLLYPMPTLYTKHVVVPFTENGRRLGELLATNPEIQQIAVSYGYRTASPEQFAAFLSENHLSAPQTLVDVIDPPSFELLERMIQGIEVKLQ